MSDVANEKPIELTLGDGSVVKGANMEEAFKNLAKMKEDTAAELRRQREELETLRTEFSTTQAELERRNQPVIEQGKFNKDEYYRMLNVDPMAAQNYMDEYRFGVANPVAAFNDMRQEVSSLKQQTVTTQFLQMHVEDFPADAESARKLTHRVSNLVNSGIPFNVDTLNYAYGQLVQEGTLTPIEPQKVEDLPNPSLSGGGVSSITDNEISRVERMSDKELETLMRSKGLLR